MSHFTKSRSDDAIEDDEALRRRRPRAEEDLEDAPRTRPYEESIGEPSHARTHGDGMEHDVDRGRGGHLPLFDTRATEDFRMRWSEIQTGFVDDPRTAVEEANRLVGDVTDRLTDMFVQNRNELERQWAAGEEASTEDLRQSLQRYRSFFERLLNL